jgi:single-strand DNA-binding protein
MQDSDLNVVIISGNLTNDPVINETPSGKLVAEFRLASHRSYTNNGGVRRRETTFVDVVAWGSRAAWLEHEDLMCGDKVFVEGRLDLDEWRDKENGNPRSRLRIVANKMTSLWLKDDDEEETEHQADRQPAKAAHL